MKLENRATVAAPPDTVFDLLNDPERIVSCLPGAVLLGRDGDAWQGSVGVKVGPIAATYQGAVRFLDVDRATRTLLLAGRGAEQRGAGSAEAQVRIQVLPDDSGAELVIDTDLLVRGKIAQFGRGAIAAVSGRILDQFARDLADLATASDGPAVVPATPVPPPRAPSPSHSGRPAGRRPENGAVWSTGRVVAVAAATLVLGVLHGYVLGRAVTVERYHRGAHRCDS